MGWATVLGLALLGPTFFMRTISAADSQQDEPLSSVQELSSHSLLTLLERGGVNLVTGHNSVLLVHVTEQSQIISPDVKIIGSDKSRLSDLEDVTANMRLWTGKIVGQPTSWVQFMFRRSVGSDDMHILVDGVVRPHSGPELRIECQSGTDSGSECEEKWVGEGSRSDHTDETHTYEPGLDLSVLQSSAPHVPSKSTLHKSRSRRNIAVDLDNATVCEVFVDADANWVNYVSTRATNPLTTLQARFLDVVARLSFASQLFIDNFGSEVVLQIAGYYENGVTIANSFATPNPILDQYGLWLATGATETTSITSAVRGGGNPTSQEVCINLLFTHTVITSGTAGLATRPSFPGYGGGACWKGLTLKSPSSYAALNTAFVTSVGNAGPFSDAVRDLTVAHELAHNFAAKHDDDFDGSLGCALDDLNERYVMWPSIENTDDVSFSDCSIETVHKFVHIRRQATPSNSRYSHTCFENPSSVCDSDECTPSAQCRVPGACNLNGGCYSESGAPDGYPCSQSANSGYCVSESCVAYDAGCGDLLLVSFDNSQNFALEGLFRRDNTSKWNNRALFVGADDVNSEYVILYQDLVPQGFSAGWYFGQIGQFRDGSYISAPYLGDILDPGQFNIATANLNITTVDVCSPKSYELYCAKMTISFSDDQIADGIDFGGEWRRNTTAFVNNRPVFYQASNPTRTISALSFVDWGIYADGVFKDQFPITGGDYPSLFNIAQYSATDTFNHGTVTFDCTTTDSPTLSAPTSAPSPEPTSSPTAPTASPTMAPTVFICENNCSDVGTCFERECVCNVEHTQSDCGQCAPGRYESSFPTCTPLQLELSVNISELGSLFADSGSDTNALAEAVAAYLEEQLNLLLQINSTEGASNFDLRLTDTTSTEFTFSTTWPQLTEGGCTDPVASNITTSEAPTLTCDEQRIAFFNATIEFLADSPPFIGAVPVVLSPVELLSTTVATTTMVMPSSDESSFPIIPVAAGAGGGVLVIIILICCCRQKNGNDVSKAKLADLEWRRARSQSPQALNKNLEGAFEHPSTQLESSHRRERGLHPQSMKSSRGDQYNEGDHGRGQVNRHEHQYQSNNRLAPPSAINNGRRSPSQRSDGGPSYNSAASNLATSHLGVSPRHTRVSVRERSGPYGMEEAEELDAQLEAEEAAYREREWHEEKRQQKVHEQHRSEQRALEEQHYQHYHQGRQQHHDGEHRHNYPESSHQQRHIDGRQDPYYAGDKYNQQLNPQDARYAVDHHRNLQASQSAYPHHTAPDRSHSPHFYPTSF